MNNKPVTHNTHFVFKIVLYTIMSFLVCFEIMYIISRYTIVSTPILIIVPVGISLIITFLIFLIRKKLKDEVKEKIDSYLHMHFLDLIYLYVFFLIFLVALNHYNGLPSIKFEKMISYSWILIGLSITIFIFGYVLVDSFLGGIKKESKTQKLDINNYIEVRKYIEENNKYIYKINEMNFPITMLLINSIINSVATCFTIFLDDKVTEFKKIIVILSLVLSINTFICLITNITKPFIKEKSRINKLKKKQDSNLNKKYLEILEIKEEENINNYIKEKIVATNNIVTLITNKKDIDTELENLDIDEVIRTLQNYSKYFNKENNINNDILVLKENIKRIMDYIIEMKRN